MTTLSPMTGSPASISNMSEVAVPAISAHQPRKMPSNSNSKPKSGKPRKRVNTAEKRNQHNAIERARRETLNSKFLNLARLLPSLATSRRPSKSAIVNGSIDHLTFQREQRLLASSLLKQLCAERDELLNEVNSWRKMNGCALKDPRSAWSEEMEEIAAVEKEVFGSFASMGDDNDDDDANESYDQINMSYTAVSGTGLVTPRMSTDINSAPIQQALFTSAPVDGSRGPGATAGLNGINWSTDFTLGLDPSVGANAQAAAAATMPMFISDMASSSPVASNQGTVVTPPAMSELMYTHTPSPGSSHSFHTASNVSNVDLQLDSHLQGQGQGQGQAAGSSPWTPAQFALIQQQVQQAQQAQYQQAQQAASQIHQPFNPITGNSFDAMFGQQMHSLPVQQQQLQQQQQQHALNANTMPTLQSDAFTQSLVASMFPQHGKMGTAPGQVSMADLQKAIRAGVGLGLGMVGTSNNTNTTGTHWAHSQNPPVEGF